MATVSASETMSRAGMKNRLGSRRSERQSRFARPIFDAAGTAVTDDLPSDVVTRKPAPARPRLGPARCSGSKSPWAASIGEAASLIESLKSKAQLIIDTRKRKDLTHLQRV